MLFSDILPQLLPDVPGCPDITAINALRNAAIEYCRFTRSWTRTLAPVALVDNQSVYAMTAPVDARVAGVISAWVRGREVLPKTMSQVAMLVPNWLVATAEVPNYFNSNTDTITLQVFPTPLNALGAPLTLRVVLAPSLTAQNVDDGIANDHFEALLAGARARLMVVPQRAWTNLPLAKYYLDMFEGMKADARISSLHDGVSSQLTATARRFGS